MEIQRNRDRAGCLSYMEIQRYRVRIWVIWRCRVTETEFELYGDAEIQRQSVVFELYGDTEIQSGARGV